MKTKNTKTNGRVNETAQQIKALTEQLIEQGMGKGIAKKQATLKVLQSKDVKTEFERQRIVNILFYFEGRTLSNVYKVLTTTDNKDIIFEISEMLGKSKMPAFKEFKTKAKEGKTMFTIWDGLQMLRKFNKVEKTQKRLKRQNKVQAQKIAKVA